MILRFFFASILFLTLQTSLLSKELIPVSLDENLKTIPLGRYAEFIEDKEAAITFENVLTKNLQWIKFNNDSGNFGFNPNYHWIRFSLFNTGNEIERPILELGFPRLDYIEFYNFKNGKYEKTITGDTFAFQKREINDTHFAFQLEVNPHSTQTYFIRTRSTQNLSFLNPSLHKSFTFFHKETSLRDLGNGLLYGFLIIMIFYNLLLFLIIKEKVYFYLSVYIASFFIVLFSLHGIAFQYIYPENTWLANRDNYIFLPLLLITQILFVNSYLELKTNLPRIYKFMQIHVAVSLVHFLAVNFIFFDYTKFGYYSILAGIFLDNVLFLFVGIYLCKKKFRPAYFFMISWILLLLGNIFRALSNASIIPVTFFTFWSFQIGLAFMLVLISIGLADKINYLKRKLLKSNKQLEDYSEHLEEKISERTLELQSTLNTVSKLKTQQDGDYFLTSLLIEPFIINASSSENVKVDFLLIQKKKFEFYGKEQQIGGDLCHSQNLILNDKKYILFFNSDSMGKSLQGAGGAIVFGSVFFSIIERTKSNIYNKDIFPERWLKNAFVELHKVFLTFECTMLVSAVIGLIEEDTGLLYFINAEHPWIAVYADNACNFIEKEIYFTKLGSPVDSNKVFVNLYQMKQKEVILIGSDGRDDFAVNDDFNGQIINQDEKEFLKTVVEANGNLSEIHRITSTKGKIIDDYSLIRIQCLVDNVDFTYLKNLCTTSFNSNDLENALSYGLEYIAKNPSDSEFLFFLGVLYKSNRDFKKAIFYFERIRLRNPFYLDNLIELAESHYSNGNSERAKNILKECEKIDSTKPKVVFLREQLQIK